MHEEKNSHRDTYILTAYIHLTSRGLLNVPCSGCRRYLPVWRTAHLGSQRHSPISPGSSWSSLCSYWLDGEEEECQWKMCWRRSQTTKTIQTWNVPLGLTQQWLSVRSAANRGQWRARVWYGGRQLWAKFREPTNPRQAMLHTGGLNDAILNIIRN